MESTADLIRETEELEKRLLEERRILEATKKQKERLLNTIERESRLTGEAVRKSEPQSSQPQVSDKGRQSPVLADKPPRSEGILISLYSSLLYESCRCDLFLFCTYILILGVAR